MKEIFFQSEKIDEIIKKGRLMGIYIVDKKKDDERAKEQSGLEYERTEIRGDTLAYYRFDIDFVNWKCYIDHYKPLNEFFIILVVDEQES